MKEFVEKMAETIINERSCGNPSTTAICCKPKLVDMWEHWTCEPPTRFTYEHEFIPLYHQAKAIADEQYYAWLFERLEREAAAC